MPERPDVWGLVVDITGYDEKGLIVYRKASIRYSSINSCTMWALRKGADKVVIEVE